MANGLKRFGPLALLLPAAMFVVVAATQPAENFHLKLAFAGSAARFLAAHQSVGLTDAKRTLGLDSLFVLAWLAVVPFLLYRAPRLWAPPYRNGAVWKRLWIVAIVAGALDLVENALTVWLYRQHTPSGWGVVTLTAVSWWKWLAYAVALIGVVYLIVGPWFGSPFRVVFRALFHVFDLQQHPDDSQLTQPPEREPGDGIGICVSGGGIRAASVALGALRALDEPEPDGSPSWFRRARWLTAVSGGAYTASGWLVARSPSAPVAPVPGPAQDGLFDADGAWYESVAERRRYLDNGHLSLTGGILGALLRTLLVLSTITAVVVLAGWCVGHVVGSWAMYPHFPFTDAQLEHESTFSDYFPARLVVPWLVPAIGAMVAFLVAGARVAPSWRKAGKGAGLGLLAVAGLLFVLLVAIPFSMRFFTTLVQKIGAPADAAATTGARSDQSGSGNWGLTVVAVLSGLGIISALVKALLSSVKRRALRLGGVLLALLAVLLGGKVASDVARLRDGNGGNRIFDGTGVFIAALVVLLVYECTAAHRQTLNGIYRKRIAGTFALQPGSSTPLDPLGYDHEHLWPAYGNADGPELIVCATAHAHGAQVSGLPAMGFTFRAHGVTLWDRDPWRQAFIGAHAYPIGSWWEGFPRAWNVTRSAAITGAAFASAMGRQALGTTNALLVAFNLRLGCWVPNPRFREAFSDRNNQPRVNIGYLAKELFGRYHPERDPFLYVADGGHRENLGLVELLRERPRVVFAVDSSGDTPGLFTTLHEAIELAQLELGVTIQVDLAPVLRPAGDPNAVPADCAVVGSIDYPDRPPGVLVYGRYQLCEGSSVELRQFAATNPKFPNYSTADQYLTADEFAMLVALGEQVGTRLRELAPAG